MSSGEVTNSRFVRSVNVERDIWEEESLFGYVVTAGTRRVLHRIVSGIDGISGGLAWTLIGPYGSGKSALALFTAKILSGDIVAGSQSAWKLLRASDADLAQQIQGLRKPPIALLPVMVTGSREPLQLALLRGLRTTLGRFHGGRFSLVADQADRFLAQAADGKPPSGHALADLFASVLRTCLCAGTHRQAPADGESEQVGLFLVLDELGKLLEYAAAHPAQSDVYVLQLLAEYAIRSPVPFVILGILHQDFSLYADRLTARERAEWDKIRGRFEDIAFEEPADELLRLIAQARSRSPDATALDHLPAARRREFQSVCDLAWKLDAAPPGMTKAEFLQTLTCCYPLHPLVAIVLGPVFRKLAQNERSVFSFLESSEPHGLRDYMQQNVGHLYTLANLYDYLVASIGEGLYVQVHGKRWAEIETVLARLPQASPLEVALVKTIGLLGAMGQWRNLLATDSFLQAAFCDINSEDLRGALADLQRQSAVVHRRYNQSFVLWGGSDIDLDERIRTARGRAAPDKDTAKLAAEFLSPRPLVAKRHSFEKGSLRYFEIRFADPVEFERILTRPKGDADGQVVVLLCESDITDRALDEWPRDTRAKERDDLVVVIPAETRAIADALHELAALEWLKENTPQLEGDATARRELRARIGGIRRQLDEAFTAVFAPGDAEAASCDWYRKGQKLHMSSSRDIQEHLSGICDRLYAATPRLRNELVNRRKLSSAAAAARRNLIDAMVHHADQPDLGIKGTPPEKSMYLSLLAQSGIHRESAGGWHFAPPLRTADEGVRAVWSAITSYFSESEREAKSVADLYARLVAPPYGLLAGPVPVFLCAALLANDTRVALYEEGSFVPQLNITTLERLLRAPDRFSLQQWRLTGVRITVFQRLAELLDLEVTDATPDKADILAVVRPLCRFASRLNDYARKTLSISPVARQIREHLVTAARPDRLLFHDLPQACGLDPIDSHSQLSEDSLSQFIGTLRNALGELHRSYDVLLAGLAEAIGRAFHVSGTLGEIRQAITARAALLRTRVADPGLKSFILRVSDAHLDDFLWLESVVALLSQKPPGSWRDEDRARFELSLANCARLFFHLEAIAFTKEASGEEQGDDEAIRIGITSRTRPELERVIRVSPRDREEMTRIQIVVRRALTEAGVNGNGQIAAAALASIVQDLLEQ